MVTDRASGQAAHPDRESAITTEMCTADRLGLRVGLVTFVLTIALVSGLCLLSGCAATRTMTSDTLPVGTADPLYHTSYHGSDEEYHYFQLQQGMVLSHARVPIGDAQIIPGTWPHHAKRIPDIVQSSGDGRIILMRGGGLLDESTEFVPPVMTADSDGLPHSDGPEFEQR